MSNLVATHCNLLGVPYHALTMEESLRIIEEQVLHGKLPMQHTVINAAKVVLSQKDTSLLQSVMESEMINIDGQAVVWAARWLGLPAPERVAGIDLMVKLLEKAHQNAWRIYLLGATDEVLEKLQRRIAKDYPGLVVTGSRNGYFSAKEAAEVAQQIASTRSQLLFVAMPTPKKENFIREFRSVMKVPFAMGVGGSFDVLAGLTKRAPRWMQVVGLEWLFRLLQEPRRLFSRYFKTNIAFISLTLQAKLGLK